MQTRWSRITFTSLLVLGVVLAGCAKRPATTAATAPPPTAAATSSAAPGPTASAAPSMTGTPSGNGAQAGTALRGPRPALKDFSAVSDIVDIHFDFDKYDVRPGDAKILDSNARWLRSNGDLVLIEGHCDERGTTEYNLALGDRRARSAMNYLVAQGVQAHRITIVSYGKERPLCTEHNEACWSQNRRAHFLVKPQ